MSALDQIKTLVSIGQAQGLLTEEQQQIYMNIPPHTEVGYELLRDDLMDLLIVNAGQQKPSKIPNLIHAVSNKKDSSLTSVLLRGLSVYKAGGSHNAAQKRKQEEKERAARQEKEEREQQENVEKRAAISAMSQMKDSSSNPANGANTFRSIAVKAPNENIVLSNQALQTIEKIRVIRARFQEYSDIKSGKDDKAKYATIRERSGQLDTLESNIKAGIIQDQDLEGQMSTIIKSTGSPTLDDSSTTALWNTMSGQKNSSLSALIENEKKFRVALKSLPSIQQCPDSIKPAIERLGSTLPFQYDPDMQLASIAVNQFIDNLPKDLKPNDYDNVKNYLEDIKKQMISQNPKNQEMIAQNFSGFEQKLNAAQHLLITSKAHQQTSSKS